MVIFTTNTSSAEVRNYVKSEATGSNANVQTNISTKINGVETSVSVSQPGEIEVNVKNGEVSIKKSPSLKPTIIITGVEKQNIKVVKVEEIPFSIQKSQEQKPIYNLIRGLWSRLIGIFKSKT